MLTGLDASTVSLPLGENRDNALSFARCLREAVGIMDDRKSFCDVSDSKLEDALQKYAYMVASIARAQNHTDAKFVYCQRK
jgi:hypothetical protein